MSCVIVFYIQIHGLNRTRELPVDSPNVPPHAQEVLLQQRSHLSRARDLVAVRERSSAIVAVQRGALDA